MGAQPAQVSAMSEGGQGLIVAVVLPDGEPRATRAWSAEVVDAPTGRLRVAVTADDDDVIAYLTEAARGAGAVISVTAADVVTLSSVQVKGRVVAVEAPTAADLERARQHCEQFFAKVLATDGVSTEVARRFLPHETVMVDLLVGEAYDQTPGPGAGAEVRARP